MRSLLFIVVLLHAGILFGQRMELFIGANKNTFYGKNGTDFASYNSANGFSAGIGLDKIGSGKLKARITLQFDSYGGRLETKRVGTSSGESINAKVKKSVIGFCYFPLNISFKNRLDFNFGFQFSALISETNSGVVQGYDPFRLSYQYDLNERYNRFSSRTYFGISARLAYNIYLSNSIALTPQYIFHLGITPEFAHFPQETKAFRHYLCLGVSKKINRKMK